MRARPVLAVLLLLINAGCSASAPPLRATPPPEPRHPIVTPAAPDNTVTFRGLRPAVRDTRGPGTNEIMSRQPTMAPRVKRNPIPSPPAPEHPGETLQRDLQRILDAKPPPNPLPVGTIDTRPGTIRTTPGTIDTR